MLLVYARLRQVRNYAAARSSRGSICGGPLLSGAAAAHAFTTLFTKFDARIADVIDAGIKHNVYFTRVKFPLNEWSGPFATPATSHEPLLAQPSQEK